MRIHTVSGIYPKLSYPIFTPIFPFFNELIQEKEGKLRESMLQVDNTRSSQMPSLPRFSIFFSEF